MTTMTTMTGSPKQGLFSSLTLGRASRTPQPGETPTPTHPLLASSHSSLNLVADNTDAGPSQPITTRQSSWSAKTGAGEALSSLPYKPRQRYGGGLGSTGSVSSLPSSTPSNVPSNAMPTIKPATPTGMPAPPTTSTSFALPASASDALAAIEQSVFSSSSAAGASSATARLQLQSLKAAAQLIGLGNGSMGMSMIDAIFEKSQATRSKTTDRDDWSELLSVLMGGKVVSFP